MLEGRRGGREGLEILPSLFGDSEEFLRLARLSDDFLDDGLFDDWVRDERSKKTVPACRRLDCGRRSGGASGVSCERIDGKCGRRRATQIAVEIRNGGIDLIRVTDNGYGMSREDAQTCFIRHATSKIATEDDLHAILTLGFRGEALAAISAVAQVELVTRMADSDVGTRVTLSGGEIQSVVDAGCPVGTTITVEKIFYNTPARMKFLKKNATEGGYCMAAANKLALAHPEVAVRLIKDGRDAMRTPGDGKLHSAVYGVCGREFANSLTPVEAADSPSLGGTQMTVWGFVTKRELSLSTRNSQYFILNGRFIRSRTMGSALEEAYRGSIMTGRYPGCVLQAAIDPAYVDVNVHPAKTEVKFADERAAFEAVYVAVKRALASASRPTFAAPRTPDGAARVVPAATERDGSPDPAVHRQEQECLPNVPGLKDAVRFDVPETPEQSRFAPQVLRAAVPPYSALPVQDGLRSLRPDVGARTLKTEFLIRLQKSRFQIRWWNGRRQI